MSWVMLWVPSIRLVKGKNNFISFEKNTPLASEQSFPLELRQNVKCKDNVTKSISFKVDILISLIYKKTKAPLVNLLKWAGKNTIFRCWTLDMFGSLFLFSNKFRSGYQIVFHSRYIRPLFAISSEAGTGCFLRL